MSLPRGWVQTSVKEITFRDRPREMPSDYPHLPFVGMENVEAHSMRLLSTVPAATMKSSGVHFKPGDVLYGRLRPYLNKVLKAVIEGLCSAEFIVFSDYGYINPSWLAYRLNSSDFVSFAAHLNEGDRPRVDHQQISPFLIDLPPRPEQDRIVAEIEKQFTRLDDAVSALKRVQANLKRYRAAVLKTAYEGRLVPTEAELARKECRVYEPASKLLKRILAERRAKWEADQLQKMIAARKQPKANEWKIGYVEKMGPDASILPKLPTGWEWVSLGQLLREPLRNGHSAKESLTGDGVRTLTLTAITTGDFSEPNIKMTNAARNKVRDLWLESGDIFVERSNTPELVGISRLFTGPSSFAIFPDLLIRVRVSVLLDTKFVATVLLSDRTRNYFRRSAQGISGSMPKIDQTTIERTAIPLPPRDEQTRITEAVQRQISQIDAAQKTVEIRLRTAQRLRQAILQTAFSGKLVPQFSHDEPACVLLERIRAERIGQGTNGKAPNVTNIASPANNQRRRRVKKLAQRVSAGKA